MKNNIMKKWVKALRSGKYKQGIGMLKQFNSKGQAQHCCLGVLCELYNEEMKKNHKKALTEKICDNDSYHFKYGYTKFNGTSCALPEDVKKWSGIRTNYGKFYGNNDLYYSSNEEKNDLSTPLDFLNDSGAKFKTISNIIEKNWENL